MAKISVTRLFLAILKSLGLGQTIISHIILIFSPKSFRLSYTFKKNFDSHFQLL